MSRSRLVSAALLSAVLLATSACGGGSPESTGGGGNDGSGSAAEKPKRDACELVPLADAERITGETLGAGYSADNGVGNAQCFYGLPEGTPLDLDIDDPDDRTRIGEAVGKARFSVELTYEGIPEEYDFEEACSSPVQTEGDVQFCSRASSTEGDVYPDAIDGHYSAMLDGDTVDIWWEAKDPGDNGTTRQAMEPKMLELGKVAVANLS